MSVLARYYIDTNVLINYQLGHVVKGFADRATRFLLQVEDGRYEGIVSILTLLEFISAARRILAEKGDVDDSDQREEIVSESVEAIFQMKNLTMVDFSHDEITLSDSLLRAYDVLRRYFTGRTTSNGRHLTLKAADALHIVMAQRLGCDKIVTFDENFVETEPEIEPILLQRWEPDA
ncbi:MAG: type II toxin-antitoxin system VapC family toxin [Candidatus Geothermarchaeales archaeon]